MSEEFKLQDEVIRANQAKTLLADPLIADAIDKCRTRYIAEIERATGKDETWMAKERLRALSEFLGHFRQLVETGKMAEKQLGLMQRMKDALR